MYIMRLEELLNEGIKLACWPVTESRKPRTAQANEKIYKLIEGNPLGPTFKCAFERMTDLRTIYVVYVISNIGY